MTDDPAGEIARAAGVRLAAEFGPRTEIEVDAALFARDFPGKTEQYDPVSIGILIVAIATLAWMIYSDHRKESPEAPPEATKRVLRHELSREIEATPTSLRVTEVVITEIIDRQ